MSTPYLDSPEDESLYTRDRVEWEMQREMDREFEEDCDDVTTWRMATGQVILIKDMEDTHLINTIRMLERNAPARMEQLYYDMLDYAEDAPDGAQACAEAGANELENMDVEEFLETDDTYQALRKEAKRRKLKYKKATPEPISMWDIPVDGA